MTNEAAAKAEDRAPGKTTHRIFFSESFDFDQKVIRKIALEEVGHYETTVGLAGTGIGQDVYLIKPVIPKAKVRHSYFRVSPRNWSAAWSAFEKREPALKPVGDAHYHPESYSREVDWGCSSPHPSSTDRGNSLTQAGLYFPFNLQTTEHETVLNAAGTQGEDGALVLPIDRMRSLYLRIKGLAGPEGVIQALYREKERRAYWASVIYPSNADHRHLHASMIAHNVQARSGDEIQVRILDEVPAVRLSDVEMAERTGIALEKIRSTIDPGEVRKEVRAKYRKAKEHSYWRRHDDDGDDEDDRARGRSVGWGTTQDYPVVAYGGGFAAFGCGSEEDRRRDPKEVAQMLRKAAEWIEKDRTTADGVWDRRLETHREEAIWDLSACIHWLRSRQPWGKA
jgi:hypothetical protein